MRSIPLMMAWEQVARGGRFVVICLLAANILPVLLFCLLRSKGLDADDPSMKQVLSRLQFLNLFFGLASAIPVDGFRTRFYVFPCTTAQLATYQLFPQMLHAGFNVIVLIAVQNLIFGQDFPVWGPALFAVSGTAVYRATYWYTKDIAWFNRGMLEGTTMILPMAILLNCYVVRFGFLTSNIDVTHDSGIGESCAHFAVVFVAYFVTKSGIARNRCGEVSYSQDVPDFFNPRSRSDSRFPEFRTTHAAQFWFLWKGNAWTSPAFVVVFSLMGMIGVGLSQSSIRSDKTAEALIASGFVLGYAGGIIAAASMVGRYCANRKGLSPGDALEFGHFFATRPMTDDAMARSILQASTCTAALACLVWALTQLIVVVVLYLSGSELLSALMEKTRWWYFPAAVLTFWIFVAVGCSVLLVGRRDALLRCAIAGIGIPIAVLFLSESLLPQESKVKLFGLLQVVGGIGLVLGSGYLFSKALRRSLIARSTTVLCIGIWLVLAAGIFFEWRYRSGELPTRYLLAVGIATLTVVPFAATPLAVGLNRHR